jgi:hypothetical protein
MRFRPEHLAAPETYARRVFRGLAAGAPRPASLVVDDYHLVRSESLLHRALAEGARELPRATVLVVASRSGPPPEMARLRACGALVEICAADLVLTPAETRAVARLRARGAPPSDEALRAAQGWAAGVVLVALAGGSRGDAARVGRRHALEFLAAEAFDRLDPATRDVLVSTSILPVVDVEVAGRLAPRREVAELLGELARAGWFVERVDGARPAYRYHALFRDLLVARARELMGEEGFLALSRRAADLLAEGGDPDAALTVLAEAGAWTALAQTLLERAPALLVAGRSEAFDRWIERLPGDLVRARPWLEFWRGVGRFTREPRAAIAAVERAHAAFVEAGDAVGAFRSWAAATDMHIFALEDLSPVQGDLAALDVLRERFGEPPDPGTDAAVVAAALGAYGNVCPADPRCAGLAERAVAIALSPGDARTRLNVGRQLAFHLSFWGADVIRSRMLVEALRPLAGDERADLGDALVWHVGEANVHAHAGEGEAARAAAQRGLDLGARAGVRLWDGLLLSARIFGALADEDLPAAEADLRRLRDTLDGAPPLHLCSYHYSASVVALRRGHVREACERAREAARLAARAAHPLARSASVVSWAAAAERGGGPGPTLGEAAAAADAAGYRYGAIGARLVSAAEALARGDDDASLAALEPALAAMRELGCTNSVWASRAETADLCALALERGIEARFVTALVSARRLAPGRRARSLAAWPWQVRVEALGGFALRRDGAEERPGKAQRKPLELLRLLVAHGERGAPLGRLAEELWPDADGDTGHHALETTMYRLRRLLADPTALVRRGGRAALDPGRVFVDAWAFEALARRAEDHHAGGDAAKARRAAAAAIALYRGDLLPDDDLPAVAGARERLRARAEPLRPPPRA